MLGLGRASQYAGWWGGEPRFASTSSTAMTYRGQYLDAVSLTPNAWSMPPATRSFDNTSLVSGARGTQAISFKYAAQSNFTWRTDDFRTQYQSINYDSPDTGLLNLTDWTYFRETDGNNWTIRLARTVTGNYLSVFSSFGAYDFFTLSGNLTWDSRAGQYLTLVISYSSVQTDFVNWTGVTGGTNWYQRIVLQDASTGQLLSTTDVRYDPFQTPDTDWADYTWSWDNANSGSPTTANTFIPLLNGSSGVNFAQTDMLAAAWWGCQGAVVDPLAVVDGVQLRQYFVGQCFPETVNGVRAWGNFTPFDLTTVDDQSLLTQVLPGRMAQTNKYAYATVTATLITPVTDSQIP